MFRFDERLFMGTGLYVLDANGNPVREHDTIKWGLWLEEFDNRRVALTVIGDSKVSTVFLGLDHNYYDKGPPILWETMVFGGKLNQEQWRCAGSREQAEAMHALAVLKVKKAQNETNT